MVSQINKPLIRLSARVLALTQQRVQGNKQDIAERKKSLP